METSFLADVHVGRLARLLRLLGFDTVYRNDFSKRELVAIAQTQNRVLLSRDTAFATNPLVRFVWIEKEEPYEQVKQVIRQLGLKEKFQPFTRCLACNGILRTVEKTAVLDRLQGNTSNYFDAFWQCSDCGRIYWKGSHYERMQKLLEQLTG